MTEKTSPIIDFYPTEFETDLNGKKNDWEAVVLIKFIDEVCWFIFYSEVVIGRKVSVIINWCFYNILES